VKYLKFFTFLDRDAITALEQATTSAPENREAQRVLAREVTALVHGQDALARAEHASTVLFGEDIATLEADEVLAVFEDVPSTELSADALAGDGIGIVDLVARVQLASSKAEARRLVQSGGIYVNNRRVSDVQMRLTRDLAIGGRLFLLRKARNRIISSAWRHDSRTADLTYRDRYAILPERSVRKKSAGEVRRVFSRERVTPVQPARPCERLVSGLTEIVGF